MQDSILSLHFHYAAESIQIEIYSLCKKIVGHI
jgi:hypothetical protein